MSNDIRAALERLLNAVDGPRYDAFERQDAIAAARAALAEPVGEGPSHGDICQFLEQQGHWGDNANRISRIANKVEV